MSDHYNPINGKTIQLGQASCQKRIALNRFTQLALIFRTVSVRVKALEYLK